MITYTKRNVFIITFLLTMLIFCILNFFLGNTILKLQNPYSNFNNNTSKIYSDVIPIELVELKEIVKIGSNNLSKGEKKSRSNILKEKNFIQKDIEKRYSYIKWRIKIPKLNLDVHISEGTTQGVLLLSVGHFEQTNKWDGNVALAAHNRGYNCNFFQDIYTLKKGDKIIYKLDNKQRTYIVDVNKVIKETDWKYIQDTKDNRITLITCEKDKREYRRCIQAIQLKEE